MSTVSLHPESGAGWSLRASRCGPAAPHAIGATAVIPNPCRGRFLSLVARAPNNLAQFLPEEERGCGGQDAAHDHHAAQSAGTGPRDCRKVRRAARTCWIRPKRRAAANLFG